MPGEPGIFPLGESLVGHNKSQVVRMMAGVFLTAASCAANRTERADSQRAALEKACDPRRES